MSDPVNPAHYQQGVSPLEAIRATQGEEAVEAFCVGNALKYVMRYRHKNGHQDLKKAVWYLLFALTGDEAFCKKITEEINAHSA